MVEEYCAPDGVPYGQRRLVGSAQAVEVSLPQALTDLPLPEQGIQRRGTRLLPLSGKSETALRQLAERYLSWLDEHAEDLASNNAAEPLLSDMAWTAGVGQEPF